MTTNSSSLSNISMPRLLLHLEGLVLLAASLVLYNNREFGWGAFALFLFAPDLAIIPYAINKRVGQIVYNIVHTIILPLTLALYSFLNASDIGIQASLIWFAHIGMDHLFGYGFKYPGSFKDTHFSRV
jgi:hypothetical protein